jgi:hypothetical protein
MKKCSICKEVKDLSEFNKNKNKKDGLSTDCRCCTKIYLEQYRNSNREKLLQQSRVFKENNREIINSKNRESYHQYKKLDEDFMKKKREANRLYKASNKGKVNSDTAKRYLSKLNRLSITTKSDLEAISKIYEQAAELTRTTGIRYHVDHIIPLQGELVSGLHIPSNLQIITEQENCSKHNKFVV